MGAWHEWLPGGPGAEERAGVGGAGAGWFPDLADTRLRQVTWPAIGKHHEYITAQLKAGVRMSTIHQRLRDEHGRQRAELAPACPRPRSWSPTCTT